jgi:predicted HTH domain antitoxin
MQPEKKLSIPDAFMPFMNFIQGESLEEKIKVALSVNLYINGSVSLAKAAELSGNSLEGFIKILEQQDIPWGEYNEDMKKQDDKVINKMLKEMGLTR